MQLGSRWVQRDATPSSLGRAILSMKRAWYAALVSTIFAVVSTTASYLAIIQPVFLPNDFTNPAVQRFVSSRAYQDASRPFFAKLDQLNNKNATGGHDVAPTDFLMTDDSQFGLVVSIYYKAVRLSDDIDKSKAKSTSAGGPGYMYRPQITVRPFLPWLILFAALEISLVICIMAYALRKAPVAQRAFEERALAEYFSDRTSGGVANDRSASAIMVIENILHHFHTFAMQLNRRHDARPGIELRDEHDVQDMLDAVLKINFRDIKREEPVPSSVGASSRIDFLLRDEAIGIEVKMTREGLRDGKLGNELLMDLARYSAHPACRYVLFFIYDPGHRVRNPTGLRSDLVDKGQSLGMPVNVIYAPPR